MLRTANSRAVNDQSSRLRRPSKGRNILEPISVFLLRPLDGPPTKALAAGFRDGRFSART
jgi:hypothetical protein